MTNKIFFSAILSILILGFFSCKKDTYPNAGVANYLLIGRAGGFANFVLLKYSLITSNELKEDTTVPYAKVPDRIDQFNFAYKLPDSAFQKVKYLMARIPPVLLAQNNTHIGQI